jgi:hypothetical protein
MPRRAHPNDIWLKVKIMEMIIMQISPTFCYLDTNNFSRATSASSGFSYGGSKANGKTYFNAHSTRFILL